MERLAFDVEVPYSGLEATVHLARYAIARPLCAGRRVLDVACGEGYGSRLLRDWGACEVEGVDVSREAIDRANRLFATPGLNYSVQDAERIDAAFADRRFDLIVSIETIEHLRDPVAFLRAIARLLAPGGHVVLTCPNDWWYYPTQAESNAFHVRKYHHAEFMALAESVLGAPTHAGIGTALTGFVNVALSEIDSPDEARGQLRMMQARAADNAFVVPMEGAGGPRRENGSYFFAIWGQAAMPEYGAAMLPVPMDIFRNGMYGGGPLHAEAVTLRARLTELQARSVEWQAQLAESVASAQQSRADVASLSERLREAQLRYAAAAVENDVLHENVGRLRLEHQAAHERCGELGAALEAERRLRIECDAQRHVTAIAAHRYFRLRRMVPGPVLWIVRKMRDVLRSGKRSST